ncbi:hypothetical protein ACLKA6_017609 [Drosophila palustris]
MTANLSELATSLYERCFLVPVASVGFGIGGCAAFRFVEPASISGTLAGVAPAPGFALPRFGRLISGVVFADLFRFNELPAFLRLSTLGIGCFAMTRACLSGAVVC